MKGIGLSFGFDSLTFLVSAMTLWAMTVNKPIEKGKHTGKAVWDSIRSGLSGMWRDQTLRALFFIIAAINLLFNGPVTVGVPFLADLRFEGAVSFGLLMSAFGGGSLLGTLLAGTLPRPSPRYFGPLLLSIMSLLGIGLTLLAFIWSAVLAAFVALIMGTANGYVLVLFVTWLQACTPQAMQGRMMSFVLFASLGLVPVSMAFSGALIELNEQALFVGAGSLLTLIMLLSAFNPAVRGMGFKKQIEFSNPLLIMERPPPRKRRRLEIRD